MAGELVEAVGDRRTGEPLTRSECEVLAVLARGASVAGAATTLGLPVHEVRASLASAIRRLGARSKLEAVLIALRWGAIDL